MNQERPLPLPGPEPILPVEQQIETVFTPADHDAISHVDISVAAAKAQSQLGSEAQSASVPHPLDTLRRIEIENDVVEARLGNETDKAVSGNEPANEGRLTGDDALMDLLTRKSDYRGGDTEHIMRAAYEGEVRRQNPPQSKTSSDGSGDSA